MVRHSRQRHRNGRPVYSYETWYEWPGDDAIAERIAAGETLWVWERLGLNGDGVEVWYGLFGPGSQGGRDAENRY